MEVLSKPRYKSSPMKLFFENYVLHVLRLLPEEKADLLQELNLQKVFGTKAARWDESVQEVMQLSPTIEVAIWDMWIKSKESYLTAQRSFSDFAKDFTDNFMKEDTKINNWTEFTYKAAVGRVNTYIQNMI